MSRSLQVKFHLRISIYAKWNSIKGLLKHSRLIHLLCVCLFFTLPLSPSPPFPFNLFPANPTHSSLIRTIAGSGVANSAEIMGCRKTKGLAGLRALRCAGEPQTCQSEKIFYFSPMWNFFFSIFFGKMASAMRLRLGLFSLATSTFPEQHISERGKKEQKIWLQQQRLRETEALAEDNKKWRTEQ